ncbi:MAG: RDD family protein [Bdellovibrionota bacterium]
MTETTQAPKIIAGFWIRVCADLIDMAILWVFAFLLGLLMEGWFLALGENGAWVGLLVSICYFVPMQSRLGNGQSLGKRILGLQVLEMSGRPLTLARSFLRYLVIAFAAYAGIFSGVVNSVVGSTLATFSNSIVGTLWFVALVGCYLLLPLHPLKRGLHDLLAGSVVVHRERFDAASLAALENPAKEKRAFAIVGAISGVAILVGIWGFIALTRFVSMAGLRDVQAKLEATGRFRSTSVADQTFKKNSVSTRSLIVQTHVDGSFDQTSEDLKPSYDLAFQTIREQIMDLSAYDNLRVGLRLGYNLGIRKRYTTIFQDENPKNPGERRDAGSRSNY